MAVVTLVVPDLERLNNVETMYMRRLNLRYNGKRDYSIFSDTENLYHLREKEREEVTGLKFRPFLYTDGLNATTGEQVFLVRRTVTLFQEKLMVSMGDDVLVNVLILKSNFFKTVIHINDAFDELQLRIKGRIDLNNFVLQTKDKVTVGGIFKVTCKSPEELLPHLDDYVINVPVGLDKELKVAVIVACYFIDLLILSC